MSLKIKFDKSSFTLKDEIDNLDKVLQQMCQTHLKNIAPAQFKLTYNDCEGDQICVTSNEDYESFIQYCESSGEKKILIMTESDEFEQGLTLPDRGKTMEEIVEECIQKQFEASVAKIKNEVTVAVKQMVSKTQEKPEDKKQNKVQQPSPQKKKQEIVEPEKKVQKPRPVLAVLTETMKELQAIQDEIASGSEKQKELSQTYWEIYKQMKEDLKVNLVLAQEEGKINKQIQKKKQKTEEKKKDNDQKTLEIQKQKLESLKKNNQQQEPEQPETQVKIEPQVLPQSQLQLPNNIQVPPQQQQPSQQQQLAQQQQQLLAQKQLLQNQQQQLLNQQQKPNQQQIPPQQLLSNQPQPPNQPLVSNQWLPKQQPQACQPQVQQPQPQQKFNYPVPVKPQNTIETPSQRAWRLTSTFGLDYTKTLSLITACPKDTDDYIVDCLLQQ